MIKGVKEIKAKSSEAKLKNEKASNARKADIARDHANKKFAKEEVGITKKEATVTKLGLDIKAMLSKASKLVKTAYNKANKVDQAKATLEAKKLKHDALKLKH